MSVFWRYWLLQIPGWIVLTGLVVVAHHGLGLSLPAAGTVLGLWFVKDAVLYPLLKPHYVVHERHPHEALLGEVGVAQETLSPNGYVKVKGELWRAELAAADAPAAQGDRVVVESVNGLTLGVRR